MSRLGELSAAGTAVWLDFVDRKFLQAGGLEKLVEADGLTGVTSNPSIFEKAMGHGDAYDESLAEYDRAHPGAATIDRYEHLAVQDIVAAADALRPVYDRLDARDGYVSLEVSPYISDDTDATIAEARKLWRAVDRPNLMIKIPGTLAGGPAIAATIAAGMNVNVTLLFSREAYARVAEAYAMGLEERVRQGQPIDRIASVASFFISRVDSEIDKRLDTIAAQLPEERRDYVAQLKGKAAIANAKLAYRLFRQLFSGPRWEALAGKGAMVQRPLWASTSTKNPSYRDTLYVEQLIGPDTVNTMPPATMDAFRDHGKLRNSLQEDVAGAEQ
ncbi:MAG TPA: transaldolase, partial [Sphingomonas sp.]|uniref:transaldolase n=1 Tax=Sphingomonas sp. TaxID=28214 RepID=UPI002ED7AD81